MVMKRLIKKILKEHVIIAEEITPEEVHRAAEKVDMEWDENEEFMDFSEEVTGERHIDDMSSLLRKKLIKKILKEEVSDVEGLAPHVSDKQQKLYDYAVKDILNNIKIIPNTVTYESIDDVLDDPSMDDVIIDIMNNWREMDGRGWRVGEADPDEISSDGPRFSKKSQPAHHMNQWAAKEEIAMELMGELVEAGKFRRITPEENEGSLVPDGGTTGGWQSLYNDYEVQIRPVKLSFPLWYDPFDNYYYPFGFDENRFRLRIIKYLDEIYGINSDESNKLLVGIKKGIRDRFVEEGINVNYENPWGMTLSEGVIDDFVDFTKAELALDDDFGVELEDDSDELETLASYDMEDNKVKVLSKNRALPDIIRSIAHELVHHKQNKEGELTGDEEEGADGSPQENEANASAGKIVRRFGKRYPEIYDL